MNTVIKTNKLQYELDYQKLQANFDFFIIETSEDYIKSGAYILDTPLLENNVKSIYFLSGKKVIVMLQSSPENFSVMKTVVGKSKEAKCLSFEKSEINDISDYVILQLLLNSLASYESDLLRCNNLTGHFYCFHPNWKKYDKSSSGSLKKVFCLELRISPEYHLDVNVRTFTSEKYKNEIIFTKKEFKDYPKYVFSKDNTLIRKLSDDKTIGFIQREIGREKEEITFLHSRDLKKFEASKVGVISNVLDAFNNKYSGIAHVEFYEADVTNRIDYKNRSARENIKRVQGVLREYGLQIVDKIDDEYSRIFCEKVCSAIEKKYGYTPTIGKRIKKDSLNIILLHNASYYEGGKDMYNTSPKDLPIQHITFEDFDTQLGLDPSTTSVVQELIIKKDIVDKKMSLFDWTSLGFDNEISFGMETTVDGELVYVFMKVQPDGSFSFEEIKFTLFEFNEYTDCMTIFEDAKTKGEVVKGVIKNHLGEIMIIKDTGLFTFPEAHKIREYLERGDNKFRGKVPREQLFASCLDIKTYEENDKLFYYVGVKGEGMQWTIQRAANIRSVEGYESASIDFQKLLPTMSVSFVRNGQLTIVPFPFKYLREYVNRF